MGLSQLYNAPSLLSSNKKPYEQVKLKKPGDFFGYWLLNRNGIDLTGRYNGTAENNTYFGTTQKGVAAIFDGTGDRINCGNINLASITQFTLTVLTYMDGSGSDEHTLASNWDNAGLASSVLLRADPSSSNQVEGFVYLEPNITHGGNFTDLTMTTNKLHAVTLRFNSDDGSGLTAFMDNVKSATSFATSTAFDNSSSVNNFYIGDSPHTTFDGQTGGTVVCIFRKTAISDTEIFQLHNDLYRDLEPVSNVFPLPTTAAGGAFQAAWAKNSNQIIGMTP